MPRGVEFLEEESPPLEVVGDSRLAFARDASPEGPAAGDAAMAEGGGSPVAAPRAMLKLRGSVCELLRGADAELLRGWWPPGMRTGDDDAARVGDTADARRCSSRGVGSLGSSRGVAERRRREPTRRHRARPSSSTDPEAAGEGELRGRAEGKRPCGE